MTSIFFKSERKSVKAGTRTQSPWFIYIVKALAFELSGQILFCRK